MLFVATSVAAGQSATGALTTGEAIYQAGCAGCHGPNGQGMPDTTIGFDKPATFPDFSDCRSTTPELDVDWRATIHAGGQGRGFSRIMPSFAEALTSAQIDAVIGYLRGLCRDRSYPRGELNSAAAAGDGESVSGRRDGDHDGSGRTPRAGRERRAGV